MRGVGSRGGGGWEKNKPQAKAKAFYADESIKLRALATRKQFCLLLARRLSSSALRA